MSAPKYTPSLKSPSQLARCSVVWMAHAWDGGDVSQCTARRVESFIVNFELLSLIA